MENDHPTRAEMELAVAEVERMLRDLRDLRVLPPGFDRAEAEAAATEAADWLRDKLRPAEPR